MHIIDFFFYCFSFHLKVVDSFCKFAFFLILVDYFE